MSKQWSTVTTSSFFQTSSNKLSMIFTVSSQTSLLLRYIPDKWCQQIVQETYIRESRSGYLSESLPIFAFRGDDVETIHRQCKILLDRLRKAESRRCDFLCKDKPDWLSSKLDYDDTESSYLGHIGISSWKCGGYVRESGNLKPFQSEKFTFNRI